MKKLLLFVNIFLLFATFAKAQEKPTAFINAKIIPIVGQPIEQGILIVQNGKITAVGDARTVRFSSDVVQIDVSGKVIMPGLVDSHSHIGEPAGADGSAPIQPDVRVLDSVNPRASSIQRAQSGGITTVNVMPGSGHLDSGQTLYLKLRDDANAIDDLLIYDKDGKYMGGIKFANGTNPIRAGGGIFPELAPNLPRLSANNLSKRRNISEKFAKQETTNQNCRRAIWRWKRSVEVLDGKRVVHFHTHRHDDIMTALAAAKRIRFSTCFASRFRSVESRRRNCQSQSSGFDYYD